MKLIKIGRSKENDVVLENDDNISRTHAEIFQDDEGRIFLTDLGSSNGTFVNGNKIEGSTLLKQLDIVKVGKTVLPWRNFLKEDNLDDTIANKLIVEFKNQNKKAIIIKNTTPSSEIKKINDMKQIDDKNFKITNSILQSLDTMVYWSKFLAIVGYVGIGFMILIAILTLSSGYSFMIGVALLYFLLALLYFFPINNLYKFATKTRNALNSHNQNDLDLGLSALASNFKFIGIYTVIVISIYGLIFIANLL